MAGHIDAIELTKQMVRMNTINPPGDEEHCARHLGVLLENAGFKVTYHTLSSKRASLVATIGGSSEKAPLCFTGHIDTVPLGAAKWKMDPFAADTDAGKLYGRGTSDMKSGVAAFVTACVNLSGKLQRSPGLELVITAGEETGCQGAFQLSQKSGALGRAGAVVVCEPSSNYPFVGHKGAFWLNARTRGVTSHGSMPEKGVNAVFKAARAVAVLEKFRFANPPHALMGQATLNVGTIRGGLNINSVPDEAVIGIDIRTVPNVRHAELKDELERRLGVDVELETLLDLESVFTAPEDPWIQEVFEVMRPILGSRPEPRAATYFTDAAALNLVYGTPPTIILGPGEALLAHQTDEYCVVERVAESVGAYEEIARRWCNI
ncbi:MAG TPA: M20 family metallopeptidase [Burkholderiales bacterium]|nr:M20 family metallopeptidase [Burkholderiales bacterium]